MVRTKSVVTGLAMGAVALVLAGCMGSSGGGDGDSAKGPLAVWWAKGITNAEDEAARSIVDEWSKKTGTQVKIDFFEGTDLPAKISTAIKAGNAPDIAFSPDADQKLNPQLATEGKLLDVSSVIESRQDDLLPLGQNATPRGSNGEYYAVPVELMPFFPFYRADLVAEAGLPKTPPTDWDGYWSYFQKAQDELHAKGNNKVYGIGLPASTASLDGTGNLMWLFNAMGVDFLDEDGNLQNTPENIDALTRAFQWQKDLFDKGYIPQSSISWQSADNNALLESGDLVMTPNPTLSIATGAEKDNPEYYKQIALAPWPKGPDGNDVALPLQVKNLVIFASTKNPEPAKDLVSFIVQPDNLQQYMEAANGLFGPVYKSQWDNKYWESNRFVSVMKQEVLNGNITVWPYSINAKFSSVFNETLMTRAMGNVILGKATPKQAATQLMNRIETLLK